MSVGFLKIILCMFLILLYNSKTLENMSNKKKPTTGFEPMTSRLLSECSAN